MNFLRIIRILSTFARLRLDRNIPNEARKGAVATLLWILKLFPEPRTSGPESARLALEQLGPIFIKFGQILSTRKDLFSDEMSQELQKLQDQVPAFDGGTAVKIIESEIRCPIPISIYFIRFRSARICLTRPGSPCNHDHRPGRKRKSW